MTLLMEILHYKKYFDPNVNGTGTGYTYFYGLRGETPSTFRASSKAPATGARRSSSGPPTPETLGTPDWRSQFFLNPGGSYPTFDGPLMTTPSLWDSAGTARSLWQLRHQLQEYPRLDQVPAPPLLPDHPAPLRPRPVIQPDPDRRPCRRLRPHPGKQQHHRPRISGSGRSTSTTPSASGVIPMAPSTALPAPRPVP